MENICLDSLEQICFTHSFNHEFICNRNQTPANTELFLQLPNTKDEDEKKCKLKNRPLNKCFIDLLSPIIIKNVYSFIACLQNSGNVTAKHVPHRLYSTHFLLPFNL